MSEQDPNTARDPFLVTVPTFDALPVPTVLWNTGPDVMFRLVLVKYPRKVGASWESGSGIVVEVRDEDAVGATFYRPASPEERSEALLAAFEDFMAEKADALRAGVDR